ncbi:hypothetical protein HanPSC8_Chr08g0331551 [Helianthus annuus]|nr:hypothetical protein HanLR1_Chr08g0282481 [Helianthus annuus]KAJ0901971.1 hypothetical protein HanPSC8_Chr08g0331551 [Helianthus annuus]
MNILQNATNDNSVTVCTRTQSCSLSFLPTYQDYYRRHNIVITTKPQQRRKPRGGPRKAFLNHDHNKWCKR